MGAGSGDNCLACGVCGAGVRCAHGNRCLLDGIVPILLSIATGQTFVSFVSNVS